MKGAVKTPYFLFEDLPRSYLYIKIQTGYQRFKLKKVKKMIKKLTIIGLILTLLLSTSSSVTQGSTDVTPTITFLMDDEQNTLTVTYVSQPDIPWTDIEVAEGLPSMPFIGNVTVGDIIHCHGPIILRYAPNGEILYSSEFTPDITFKQNNEENKLIVKEIYQMNTPWSNITSIGLAGSYTCHIPTFGFVRAGDVITDCSGVFSLKYVPTGKIIGTFDFTDSGEETSEVGYGWVYGKVLLKSGDTTYPGKDVTVFVNEINENSVNQINEDSSSEIQAHKTLLQKDTNNAIQIQSIQSGRVTFTNENGEYNISNLKIGTYYMIRVVKNKIYSSSEKFIIGKENEGIEVNLVIEISDTRLQVDRSIESGDIGGEINIQFGNNSQYEHEITIYDGINIRPVEITRGKISLIVSSNESSVGKTIAITVDKDMFNTAENIVVEYDGEAISMAENISDVLNPNNDGLHAEYLFTYGANATEILISIPHFSEHEITIFSLAGEAIETLGGVTAVLLYITICVVAAVFFIGAIFIRRRL